MKFLWKAIRALFASLGLIVVLLAIVGVVSLRSGTAELPRKMVLSYIFYGTPQDVPPANDLLSQLMPADPTLAEVTDAIYRAAKDDRVEAFVVKLSAGDYKWADVQELRAAIAAFKASGKKTYVYSESYGELYPGMAEYYLASAFDEIWLQPVGTVAITGFSAQVPYFKKTLDMVGVTPDIIQKGQYKTAPESGLLEHMSDAQRETLHSILQSMMTDFFEGVSAGRNIPANSIGVLVDGAPYTSEEAKERKLVDHVGYADQLLEQLIPGGGEKNHDFVDAVDYLYAADGATLDKIVKDDKALKDKDTGKNSVALVYVSGMIVPDTGQRGGMFGDNMAYASEIAGAIKDAAQDDDIKAIVLRVDSPGGSPSASETIRRAVEVAKEKGKYVVVSMGGQAASGGYWVVVDADKIFTQPGTLTGSIGVFGGKASFANAFAKVGVNWDSVTMGANAGMWSPSEAYTADQRVAVSRMLDDVYDSFIHRVAQGRKFAPEIVEPMAGGRVWTGRQAKERGLVDEIGGLRQALEDVAAKLGVKDVHKLDVIVMPDAPSPFDNFLGFLGQSAQVIDFVRPAAQAVMNAHNPSWSLVRAQRFEINP